jgi:hypothetical protein
MGAGAGHDVIEAISIGESFGQLVWDAQFIATRRRTDALQSCNLRVEQWVKIHGEGRRNCNRRHNYSKQDFITWAKARAR